MPLNIQHRRNGELVPHRWSLEILFRIRRTLDELYGDNFHWKIETPFTMLDPWDEQEDAITLLEGDEITIWRD